MNKKKLTENQQFKLAAGKDYAQKLAKIVDGIATKRKLSAIQILTDKQNSQAIYDECVRQDMGLFEVGLAVGYTLDSMAGEEPISQTLH